MNDWLLSSAHLINDGCRLDADALASDCAPSLADEKAKTCTSASSGLPSVKYGLEVALKLAIEAINHRQATLFNVRKRGNVNDGNQTDLIVIDQNRPHNVEPAESLSKCGWSRFEVEILLSSIAATFFNGQHSWHPGKLDNHVRGQRLAFDR